MKPLRDDLDESVLMHNVINLIRFQGEHRLRWLGLHSGPVYVLGGLRPIRVRALFVDQAGAHYGDATLAVESLYDVPEIREAVRESFAGGTGAMAENDGWGYELQIVTRQRGWHDALIFPISVIARVLETKPPTAMPADNWARSWEEWSFVTDEAGIYHASHARTIVAGPHNVTALPPTFLRFGGFDGDPADFERWEQGE